MTWKIAFKQNYMKSLFVVPGIVKDTGDGTVQWGGGCTFRAQQ